uniref:Uncharacterized protein n=1 Tax=Crocodylus porosus TaxID=8502 RepID=A0A7M4FJY5_CROPO
IRVSHGHAPCHWVLGGDLESAPTHSMRTMGVAHGAPLLLAALGMGRQGPSEVVIPQVLATWHGEGYVQGKAVPLHWWRSALAGGVGLWGLLWLQRGTYSLEPLPDSTTFQHLLYKMEKEEDAPRLLCGLMEDELQHQVPLTHQLQWGALERQGWWLDTRHAKVAIVVDNGHFMCHHCNVTQVLAEVLDVLNMADVLYRLLSVRVWPVGMKIRTHSNLFVITKNTVVALANFTIRWWQELPTAAITPAHKSKGAYSLRQAPAPEAVYMLKYCGNKMVEKGEECDCGSTQECSRDPCCEANCTLSVSTACAFGECCSKCQILPLGRLCRKRINECDLPEYCNGTSIPVVPEGCVLCVQDGALSGWYNARKYKKCKVGDALCGRVQCENVKILPALRNHNTIVQPPINTTWCWGTVRDGTPSGNDKICFNKSCTSVSVLHYDCNLIQCHNRGICNSKRHCHCEYGWAPPSCQDKGHGGSIDTGPPPSREMVTRSYNIGIPVLSTVGILVICLCVCCRKVLRKCFRRRCGVGFGGVGPSRGHNWVGAVYRPELIPPLSQVGVPPSHASTPWHAPVPLCAWASMSPQDSAAEDMCLLRLSAWTYNHPQIPPQPRAHGPVLCHRSDRNFAWMVEAQEEIQPMGHGFSWNKPTFNFTGD